MTDKLAQVQALIARATHPETGEEEARTSAFIACKIIREEKLEVVRGRGYQAPRPPSAPPSPRHSRGTYDVSDVRINLEDLFRGAGFRQSPNSRAPRNYVAHVSSGNEKCAKCGNPIARHQFAWTAEIPGGGREVRCATCVFL